MNQARTPKPIPEPGRSDSGAVRSPYLYPRDVGRINWLGIWTLYAKEVQKFAKVPTQSILAPMATTLLFLAIFTLAFGDRYSPVAGITYSQFLAPGLIVMAVLQNSFANTASSFLISKLQGNIIDILMPPLNAGEVIFCYALAGVTRGVVVALSVYVAMSLFVDIPLSAPFVSLYFLFGAALCLSFVGIIAGIWAQKFDHMAAVTNFIITPLAFLSGTFYSIQKLPEPWVSFAQANPIFYMIDGFRFGFLDHNDGNLAIGAFLLLMLNMLLGGLAFLVFRSGWKIKS